MTLESFHMKKSLIHNGFSVLIKKDANIKFPKLCVVCGKACDVQQTLRSGTNEDASSFLHHYFLKKPKFSIPIHFTCESFWQKLHSRRGSLISIVFFISAVIVYSVNRTIDYWLLFLPLISVAIFNKIILNRFWYIEPVLFSADKIRYHFIFKDEKYAEYFEELNSDYIYKEGILRDFGA